MEVCLKVLEFGERMLRWRKMKLQPTQSTAQFGYFEPSELVKSPRAKPRRNPVSGEDYIRIDASKTQVCRGEGLLEREREIGRERNREKERAREK